MIVGELYNGQGFGNQLFTYVSTRAIAHRLGFDYGIKSPEKFKGYGLMDIDMGREVIGGSGPEGGPPDSLPEGITNYYHEYAHGRHNGIGDPRNGYHLTDTNLFELEDNTKIEGVLQSEEYFYDRIDLVKDWLKVKPEAEHDDTNGKNICVLNFRGGPIKGGLWYMPREYWLNAIDNMLSYNPNMEFGIVTDDVVSANEMLPEYPAYHESIAWDYVAIKNARNVICSASTFACFPLWTSNNLEYCIAPKYWFEHNNSNGWWSLGCSIYSYVSHYQDREGNLFTPDQCRKEWEENKKLLNFYKNDRKDFTEIKKLSPSEHLRLQKNY
tara:strand:- start:6029 stop:7006 length:978 start_codon:yes stop_codon:yes gene_type:complete